MTSMKKSSFVALAMCALAFSATAETAGGSAPRQTITATHEVTTLTAIRHVETIGVFKLAGQPLQLTATDEAAGLALQVTKLHRAEQYALDQLARNRPELTPQWRLVASV